MDTYKFVCVSDPLHHWKEKMDHRCDIYLVKKYLKFVLWGFLFVFPGSCILCLFMPALLVSF